MALNDLIIRQAKPKDKKYILSDERGLILEVRPNGQKYWVVRGWNDGKEKRRHIGKYPEMSLKEARAKSITAREQLFNDPVSENNVDLLTFGEIAAEWIIKRMKDKKESYVRTIKFRLNRYILPELKDIPINDITSGRILKLCRKIEEQELIETAKRVKTIIGQIFRYAVATDRAEYDPTTALAGALQTRKVKHMAAITKPSEIAMLIKNINAYPRVMTRCALKFSVLVFCRPGEIRNAEWSEIDFDNSEWRIPAEKMKMKREHIVPLATQVIELLTKLKQLTGSQKWLFPAVLMNGRPMSADTVRVALRSMGYTKDEITPHGFRGMASTRLNEMGWPPDVIERQLAHIEQNQVRAAYNHAEYLPERRKMMQAWADYLEKLANN